jgi:hypothetical protein
MSPDHSSSCSVVAGRPVSSLAAQRVVAALPLPPPSPAPVGAHSRMTGRQQPQQWWSRCNSIQVVNSTHNDTTMSSGPGCQMLQYTHRNPLAAAGCAYTGPSVSCVWLQICSQTLRRRCGGRNSCCWRSVHELWPAIAVATNCHDNCRW